MVECNCDIVSASKTEITIKLPHFAEDAWLALADKLKRKKVRQVYVKLGYPRKPRTTGDKSQSHHLNGHIQQIAAHTWDEFDDAKMEIKRRAIKRGYPFRTDSFGNVIPQSEADCSTVECALLIDEAHDVAAFLEIKLKET